MTLSGQKTMAQNASKTIGFGSLVLFSQLNLYSANGISIQWTEQMTDSKLYED